MLTVSPSRARSQSRPSRSLSRGVRRSSRSRGDGRRGSDSMLFPVHLRDDEVEGDMDPTSVRHTPPTHAHAGSVDRVMVDVDELLSQVSKHC